MGYTVGISSGFFAVKKEAALMGISKKLQWGVTQGVNFVQVDLEAITEFKEPDLQNKVKKSKEMGIDFGIHGETQAFGTKAVFMLDSSISSEYIHSHERIITSIKEMRPTLKEPNRSESKPAKIAKKMDGNVNKLISKPAAAWVNFNSSIIKVRMGGMDCNVKANTNIQM